MVTVLLDSVVAIKLQRWLRSGTYICTTVYITDGRSGTQMYHCEYFIDFFKSRIYNIYFDNIT